MKKKLMIEGMSCGHCTNHVKNTLLEVEGVQVVTVDLEGKSAVVELSQDVTDALLKEIIEEAGYDLVGIDNL